MLTIRKQSSAILTRWLSSSNKAARTFSANENTTRHFSTNKAHTVLKFNGDGIGSEIVSNSVKVIDATGVNIDWVHMDMGFDHHQKTGLPQISEDHLQKFDEIRVLFKGPLTIPPSASNNYIELRDRRFTSPNQVFRKIFELYANIRPAKSVIGVPTPFPQTDLVVVRENTEDLYTGEEKWIDDDTVEGVKRITRKASERIARVAYEYALKHGRKQITAVHKANVCKQADGLFLSSCKAVADQHADSGIIFNDHLADSLLTRLVQAPEEFDVLLCPNLFGDLVSDLAAGLIGSLGLMPSGQFGDHHAVFEPAHGSAPDIAGKGVVNPTSQLRSGVMMLEHLGEHEAAARIEKSILHVIAEGKYLTADMGGKYSTDDMTKAIIDAL